MIVIVLAVKTCEACPSQWDAWDAAGQYYYLRYRHGRGRVERQPSPDVATWSDEQVVARFETPGDRQTDGYIELAEFAELAGITLVPGLVEVRLDLLDREQLDEFAERLAAIRKAAG